MKHRILALISVIVITVSANAYASVLGDVTNEWATDMGAYTYFHHTTFLSSSVGSQTESYIEYNPNDMAKPVVIGGYSLWGTRNINGAVSYMEDMGIRPIGGINADYFSFKTGIPMGNAITGGEIVSTENEGQDAVAFRSDGSAFIDWLDIKTTLSNGSLSVGVECINKWYQAGYDPIFMFTDKFGDRTHTASECVFVVATPTGGRLAIGDSLTMRVDERFSYEGDITIPKGKVVLAVETSGIEECVRFLSELNTGDTITVRNDAADMDNEKWAEVTEAVSSVGGRLIINGEVRDVSDNQAAPRTAVGVKEDGSVILYTLDGRQKGYSYGAQIKTIAYRLKELGCVDAINLDGGGSTTIGAVFPGDDEFLVMNSPSDGYLRSVANFLFIRDDRERTNIPWIINFTDDNKNNNYLSGMEHSVNISSVYDTSNYRIENPDIEYSVRNEGASSHANGSVLSFIGTGKTYAVIKSGGAAEEIEYNVYETPDDIKIYNEADWRELSSITTEANEELQLNLAAAAYVGGTELNAYDSLFSWSVEGNIGTVTAEGIFTLKDTSNETGKIIVSAGGYTKEIPVIISDYPKFNPFGDTEGHWAEDILTAMQERGIIKGINDSGIMNYYPDNNMTRAEFASMICNYLGINVTEYENEPLIFSDSADIQPWAVNYVKAMYDKGIIQGRTNNDGSVSFAPEDKITRAEAITILSRTLDSKDTAELKFLDNADIPSWARDAIARLIKTGALNGYEDNTIRPNNNVKRAEAVTMLYKLMG